MAVEPCAIHHPPWLQASGLLACPGCQGAYQLAVHTSEVQVMLSAPLAELHSHLRETTMQRACVAAPMTQLLLVLNFVLLYGKAQTCTMCLLLERLQQAHPCLP